MKRSTQNGIPGSPLKRQAGYNRAEMGMSELAAAPVSESADGGGGEPTPIDRARTYVKEVLRVLKDDKENFQAYLEIMKDVQAGVQAKRIDAVETIARVKDLLKGHPALIAGFDSFFPQGYYDMTLPAEEEQLREKQPVRFNQAVNNSNNMKTRGGRHVQTPKEKNGISRPQELKRLANRNQAEMAVSLVANGGGGALPISESSASSQASVPPAGRAEVTDKALLYLKEVRDMCRDDKDKFDEYLQIMKDFKAEGIDFAKNLTRVKDFFRGHGRLILGFNAFLPAGYKITLTSKEILLATKTKEQVQYDVAKNYINKIKERFKTEEHVYKTFLQTFSMYYKRGISAQKVYQKVSDSLTEHPDLMDELRDLCPEFTDSNVPVSNTANPSYRRLPISYPKPLSSHSTEAVRGVLNDSCVCVAPGSEDHSFQHIGKNPYEERLFGCEDDQFELDLLVESASATARKVNDLVEYVQHAQFHEKKSTFDLNDHLSAMNLRCIQRIYGDHGLDIIDLLRKNPGALSVVLIRLQQKQHEWSQHRIEMNKIWADVYSKNYHKSLGRHPR